MFIFNYYDNTNYPKKQHLITLVMKNCYEADKAFQDHFGFDPVKKPLIAFTVQCLIPSNDQPH